YWNDQGDRNRDATYQQSYQQRIENIHEHTFEEHKKEANEEKQHNLHAFEDHKKKEVNESQHNLHAFQQSHEERPKDYPITTTNMRMHPPEETHTEEAA